MLSRMKMLGGVLVLRRIAAADVPADAAQSQMHPAIAHLQALLATASVRLYIANLLDMRAGTHVSIMGDAAAVRQLPRGNRGRFESPPRRAIVSTRIVRQIESRFRCIRSAICSRAQ